jgi:hypothetical protein
MKSGFWLPPKILPDGEGFTGTGSGLRSPDHSPLGAAREARSLRTLGSGPTGRPKVRDGDYTFK